MCREYCITGESFKHAASNSPANIQSNQAGCFNQDHQRPANRPAEVFWTADEGSRLAVAAVLLPKSKTSWTDRAGVTEAGEVRFCQKFT